MDPKITWYQHPYQGHFKTTIPAPPKIIETIMVLDMAHWGPRYGPLGYASCSQNVELPTFWGALRIEKTERGPHKKLKFRTHYHLLSNNSSIYPLRLLAWYLTKLLISSILKRTALK